MAGVSGDLRPWERLLPGIAVLRDYQRSWLRGDVLAGVTVTAYLIPQVMAYAVIAGLPSVVGLWALLPAMAVYVIFGASRQLSVGPESTTALMTAVGVGALAATAGPDRYAEVAALMAIAVGLVCIVGWVARLGFLASLLSRPVLIGYLVGVAVLMITSQFGKVTGLDIPNGGPIEQITALVRQLGDIHWPTFALAAVVFVLLLVANRLWPKLPGPLIILLLAAGAVAIFNLQRFGISTIGEVPQGLPAPRLPRLGDLSVWAMLPYAVGIAVVGYSDNVLTGRAFAAKRRERIDASQELFALGAANVASGLFQGFPVSSSGSRTVIGDAMGSRTQLHTIVVIVLTIATLLFAGPVLSTFPAAALGALVSYAATRLIDIPEIRRIARFRRSELVLSLVTAAGVIVLGVLAGIGIAITLSLLDLLRRLASPNDGILGYVPGMSGMHDVGDYPDARQIPGLVVYRYDSPLFFANAENFLERANAAVDASETPVRWFLLNAEANIQVDLTSVDTLELLREELEARGIEFALARVRLEIYQELKAAGFVEQVGDDRIFTTIPMAIRAYREAEGIPEED